jgi:hypothetical protein
MKWTWGGAQTITCCAAMTIIEVAQENGFANLINLQPIFISRGQILKSEFTLHAHKIQDGQTIIVHLPKSQNSHQTESIPLTYISKFSLLKKEQIMEDIEIVETGKVADQDFRNWESSRMLPMMLSELLKIAETEDEDEAEMYPILLSPTVIRKGMKISDCPLPQLINVDEI